MRYLKYAKIKRNGDECSIHIEREDGTLDFYGTYQIMSEDFTKDLEKLAHDGYTVEWEGKQIQMARNSLKSVLNILDAINEDIPVEQMFVNDLNRSIELNDKKDARPGSKTYKPSGMNCMRQSYYFLTDTKSDDEEPNSNSVGICESGSDRHERIQKAVLRMKENGIDCEYINVADFVRQRELEYLDITKEPNFEEGEYETKLYHKELNMSFLCDGIIKYHNHYYILEIKTETINKFFNRREVDPSHYHQATAYSLSFGIDEVLFLYECRDNCHKKCFLFKVTDRMRKDLIKYIKTCDKYISKKEVPPKAEDILKKTCNYCAYKNKCKEDM